MSQILCIVGSVFLAIIILIVLILAISLVGWLAENYLIARIIGWIVGGAVTLLFLIFVSWGLYDHCRAFWS